MNRKMEAAMTQNSYINLKEYVDMRVVAIEKNIEMAAHALDIKMQNVNNFRRDFEQDIRMLREYKAAMDGKASQASVFLSYLIAGAGLIIGIIGFFK